MAKLSDTYSRLFDEFRRVESEMADHQPDRQRDLLSAARRIVRFEVENDLPRLRELVASHSSAVSQIEVARQKLSRLSGAITNQESYIRGRFATVDVTPDVLDLLGWREGARLGAEAVELLTAQAAEREAELRDFVKAHKGVSDCLAVEQSKSYWQKPERENFSWLARDVGQELNAKAVAA